MKLRYNWFQFQTLPPSSQPSEVSRHRLGVVCRSAVLNQNIFLKKQNFPAAINHILTGWSSNKNNTGLTTTTRPEECKDSLHIIIIHHRPQCKKGLHHQNIGPGDMFCCWRVRYPTLSILEKEGVTLRFISKRFFQH